MTYLFFSYSRKDNNLARQVVTSLSGDGFVLWQDVNDLRGGDNWRDAIYKAIDDSVVFLLLWSAASSQSQYVREEMQYARTRQKRIVPLLLDDTPLAPDLVNIQWVRWNDSQGLEKLKGALPSEIRRRRTGFDPTKKMGDQAGARMIEGGNLICAPLIESSYCKAFIVAPPDAQVRNPSALHLALQFSQDVNDGMVIEMYQYYQASAPKDGSLPFAVVLVTGPTVGGKFQLENRNPAHWTDALGTTEEALTAAKGNARPVLHVFALAPAALTFAIGSTYSRFNSLFLYNYIALRGRMPNELPYQLIMVL